MSEYRASKLGLGAFEEGVARAATAPGERVLVSVFMPGGVDAMSLLAPVGDPKYATYRPTLQLDGASTTPFAEDPNLHWHPSAEPLRALHGEGKVTVIPAIGYDHPDQSHFTSRHYWEFGATDTSAPTGWLGRYLDVIGNADNPLQGLSLDVTGNPTNPLPGPSPDGRRGPTLATAQMPVAAIDAPASYDLGVDNVA